MVIGHGLRHCAFEIAQPWPDRQLPLGQPVLPDVDMDCLLDRECETRCLMVEDCGCDRKRRLAMENATGCAAVADCLLRKRVLEPKPRGSARERAIDLGRQNDEVARVAMRQVPTIGMQFMLDLIDEAFWPIEADRLLSADQQSQKVIEADEVIDMGVRDK